MSEWTPQPGDEVTVRGGDEEWTVKFVPTDPPLPWATLEREGEDVNPTVPLSWLTPVTPPLPPEPQEPGTPVWSIPAGRVAAVRLTTRNAAHWGVPGSSVPATWGEVVEEFGPLTTTPPGTVPAAALSDDRAEELGRVFDRGALADPDSRRSPDERLHDGIRAVLADLRESAGQPQPPAGVVVDPDDPAQVEVVGLFTMTVSSTDWPSSSSTARTTSRAARPSRVAPTH